MPTYSAFLTTWLNNLMMIYAGGDMGRFWLTLKMFIHALPEDIKRDLAKKCVAVDTAIDERLRQIGGNSVSKHIINEKRRSFTQAYLAEKAPEIWSQMQKALDQKNLKIISGSGLFDPSEGKKSGKNSQNSHKGFPSIMDTGVRTDAGRSNA